MLPACSPKLIFISFYCGFLSPCFFLFWPVFFSLADGARLVRGDKARSGHGGGAAAAAAAAGPALQRAEAQEASAGRPLPRIHGSPVL